MNQELKDFLNKIIEEPYPEDVFLPISSEELGKIHQTLLIQYSMPLDRLTGHIGRLLRKPLAEMAKQFIDEAQASDVPVGDGKDAIAFHKWMKENDTVENAAEWFHCSDEDMYRVFKQITFPPAGTLK